MRAVLGLIFMAVSVKVAKTDPMPLKLEVEVLSKENPKVFKKRPIHILVPSGRLKGYVFVYKQDYGTSDLVPGYGPASRDRGPWDGPCEPKGASCGKRRGKGKCCRGLLCYGHRTQTDNYRISEDLYRIRGLRYHFYRYRYDTDTMQVWIFDTDTILILFSDKISIPILILILFSYKISIPILILILPSNGLIPNLIPKFA